LVLNPLALIHPSIHTLRIRLLKLVHMRLGRRAEARP